MIAVFDNVDRRDVANQLAAFQLALWFGPDAVPSHPSDADTTSRRTRTPSA